MNTFQENLNILQICSMCSAVFITIADLLNHTDNEHPDASQRCSICLKVNVFIIIFIHLQKMCLKYFLPVFINFCLYNLLKVFASVRTATRHRKLCKELERKFKCATCGLKFAYELSLNKHILRHHEGERVSVKFIDSKQKLADKKFPCDSCNRSFYRYTGFIYFVLE